MDLARLKEGDQVNVTVMPDSGAIVLMPLRTGHSKKEIRSVIKKTAKDYRKTLRKLACARRPTIVFISASTSFASFTRKRSKDSADWKVFVTKDSDDGGDRVPEVEWNRAAPG